MATINEIRHVLEMCEEFPDLEYGTQYHEDTFNDICAFSINEPWGDHFNTWALKATNLEIVNYVKEKALEQLQQHQSNG